MTTIMIIGPQGKMGAATCLAIEESPHYKLIAKVGRNDYLEQTLSSLKPDIAIEFTNASSVYHHSKILLNKGIKTIVGSSGLNQEQVNELSSICNMRKTGCIIAPNFSIGAILMMKFSSLAAKFFSEVEIVETHHQQKLDAPSGTALKTAQLIQQSRNESKQINKSKELYDGARGAEVHDVNIHSLRLPGYIASQQVMFGGQGENFTIGHNSISRDCFMPGVLLACQKVQTINHLVYGLEHLLDC